MCGINGILRLSRDASPIDRGELLRTRDAMRARGPDASGCWISSDGSVGLGHRRLSIIDLSEAGRQPMSRADGRYQIVFNGEIYNYRELRRELVEDGYRFQSECDTEVLLNLYLRDGDKMMERLNGIYAFAIHDTRDDSLLVVRDGLGVKPLYYAETERGFIFASEIKALLQERSIDRTIDGAR